MIVALNMAGSAQEVIVPVAGRIRLSTYLDREWEVASDGVIALRPHEGLVVEPL